jgi:hypothetical protein
LYTLLGEMNGWTGGSPEDLSGQPVRLIAEMGEDLLSSGRVDL